MGSSAISLKLSGTREKEYATEKSLEESINMQKTLPDKNGHFGIFGGRYAAETLMPALLELEKAYEAARQDRAFLREWRGYLHDYAGRETPLFLAQRLTEQMDGAAIY